MTKVIPVFDSKTHTVHPIWYSTTNPNQFIKTRIRDLSYTNNDNSPMGLEELSRLNLGETKF